MKRIKILIIITTIFFCAFIPLACKKSFLEQDNTFGISPQAAASKPEQVISLVNAIYDTYQNSDLLKKCIWYRANFGTHDFFNWGADVFWNNYQLPPTFVGLITFWNQSYIGIARANSVFKIITEAEAGGVINPALAKRLRGEAFFLRGMTGAFGFSVILARNFFQAASSSTELVWASFRLSSHARHDVRLPTD